MSQTGEDVDIEGDFSLDSNAFSESSATIQSDFKPLWTPDAALSPDSRNEIERILLEDSASSHRNSFLDSPSGACQRTPNTSLGGWSKSEEELLLKLLEEHGDKWCKIAKKLNKSGLEVKVYASKLLQQKAAKPVPPPRPPEKSLLSLVHGGRRKRTNPVQALTFDSTKPLVKTTISPGDIVQIKADDDNDSDVDISVVDDEEPKAPPVKSPRKSPRGGSERLVSVNTRAFKKPSTSTKVDTPSVSHSPEAGVYPDKEIRFDPYQILPFEEKDNPEYFNGKSTQKTAERYLKIRNHIVDLWTKQKPRYLNKTTSRIGLKNCGDVNCIGAIHDYLERIGAINFGCPQVVKPVKKKPQVDISNKSLRRRKKVANFVSQADLESGGLTIEHDSVTGEVLSKTLVTPQQVTMASTSAEKQKRKPSPFKLVPCVRYETKEPPFSLEVCVGAAIICEVHSHLVTNEVIGLLGGYESSGFLKVLLAVPCRAISSGQECDMDPVSQYEAMSEIQGRGLSVVGWYHSHPTFEPHPSLRDLTTQVDYQNLFSSTNSPFIAFIFSPYLVPIKNPTAVGSKFSSFIVERHPLTNDYCPFSIKAKIVNSEQGLTLSETLMVVDRLLKDIGSQDVQLVNTSLRFSENFTKLEKMLSTLQYHLLKAKVPCEEVSSFLDNIQSVLHKHQSSPSTSTQ